MSRLGPFRQLLIVMTLLGLLVIVINARAAEMLDEELLVDPTAPLVLTLQGASDDDRPGFLPGALFTGVENYKLGSILIRQEDRVAVINDQRVRVGELIGNARVTAIEQGSVTLNVDGEVQILELYANSIKTLVKGEG